MSNLGDQRSQYISAISVSILSLTAGFNFAWPSANLPLLTAKDSPIGVQLNVAQGAWVSSISSLGILIGNLFLGQLQDLVGRRGLLLLATIPTVTGWIMIAFARSYEVLLAGMFICGTAVVVPTMTSCVYIGEISDASIRGKLSMFNLCMIDVGMVTITALGSYTTYITTCIVCGSVPLVFLLIFYWMPESPYFYLRKGDVDRAKMSLKRLRVNVDVDKELLNMQTSVEKEMNEKGGIGELFKTAKYRKAIFIGLGLKTLMQMSGTAAIYSYNKVIFEQVSTGLDSSQSAIISSAVSIPSVLIGSALIDKLGRKPLYYISTIGCAVSLMFEFVYFLMQDNLHSDVSHIGWLPFAGIFLFNIFRMIGIQTIPFIILSEIFPANIKAVGLNFILVYSSILGFLVTLGFPLLAEAWGMYTCFGIFVGFCLLGFCFIFFFLPETKGKSLGDIHNKIEKAVQSEK